MVRGQARANADGKESAPRASALIPVQVAALLIPALIVLAGLLVTLPRWSRALDVGAEQPAPVNGEGPGYFNYFGFHEPELARQVAQRHFRWTSDDRATVTFPYVQRRGPLALELAGRRLDRILAGKVRGRRH